MTPCQHIETTIAQRVYRDGRRAYVRQCVRCGSQTETLKTERALLLIANGHKSTDWDDGIAKRFRETEGEAFRAELARKQEEQAAERRRQYQLYLLTDKWKDKRERVMERDGRLCQACRRRPATEVHHRTYEHIFNEPLFDLVAVCRTCHENLHSHL